MPRTTDDALDLGAFKWELMNARRAEGDARRREAAARGRQHHAQAQLYRAQLAYESREAEAASLSKQLRDGEMAHRREAAALREASNSCVPIAQLQVRGRLPRSSPTPLPHFPLLTPCIPYAMQAQSKKLEQHAQRSAKAARDAATHSKEREALITELAAAHARDADQRALITAIADADKVRAHRSLVEPPPKSAAVADDVHKAITAAGENDGGVANLAELSEAKTTLRVSELRLKRRAAALEVSELREREAAQVTGCRCHRHRHCHRHLRHHSPPPPPQPSAGGARRSGGTRGGARPLRGREGERRARGEARGRGVVDGGGRGSRRRGGARRTSGAARDAHPAAEARRCFGEHGQRRPPPRADGRHDADARSRWRRRRAGGGGGGGGCGGGACGARGDGPAARGA